MPDCSATDGLKKGRTAFSVFVLLGEICLHKQLIETECFSCVLTGENEGKTALREHGWRGRGGCD